MRRALGLSLQGGGHIRREIVALRTFGHQDDVNGVTGLDAAVATPRRSQREPTPVAEPLDDSANAVAIHPAGDVVLRFRSPRLVRIERHGHHHPFP